jgi:hypothetical protein
VGRGLTPKGRPDLGGHLSAEPEIAGERPHPGAYPGPARLAKLVLEHRFVQVPPGLAEGSGLACGCSATNGIATSGRSTLGYLGPRPKAPKAPKATGVHFPREETNGEEASAPQERSPRRKDNRNEVRLNPRRDVLVSWNFKHIVRLGKIRLYSAVNLEVGHKPIEIYSPREVASYEE